MSDLIQSRRSTAHPALEQLAASVDIASRPRTLLRPDGILEVRVAGEVIGWVDYQRPVYVVLAGPRWDVAEEVGQRLDLPGAIEVLLAC